jgi:hypothetical protein
MWRDKALRLDDCPGSRIAAQALEAGTMRTAEQVVLRVTDCSR